MNLNEIKEKRFKTENGTSSYINVSLEEMDWVLERAELYEKALKRIMSNLEDCCGTVDKPRRPTMDDVYEVYLITREALK